MPLIAGEEHGEPATLTALGRKLVGLEHWGTEAAEAAEAAAAAEAAEAAEAAAAEVAEAAAAEGLFAARRLRPGEVAAFFGGRRVRCARDGDGDGGNDGGGGGGGGAGGGDGEHARGGGGGTEDEAERGLWSEPDWGTLTTDGWVWVPPAWRGTSAYAASTGTPGGD